MCGSLDTASIHSVVSDILTFGCLSWQHRQDNLSRSAFMRSHALELKPEHEVSQNNLQQ